MTGMAPKKYIDRHTVPMWKIVTMNLTLEEKVVVFGLTVAGGCGLFLLGNYGVEGDFRNDAEEYFFVSIMATGTLSLLITAVWKGLVIRDEIKRDNIEQSEGSDLTVEASVEVNPTARSDNDNEGPFLTEISTVWVGIAAGEIRRGV